MHPYDSIVACQQVAADCFDSVDPKRPLFRPLADAPLRESPSKRPAGNSDLLVNQSSQPCDQTTKHEVTAMTEKEDHLSSEVARLQKEASPIPRR
jgi:hypothetical protein